MICSDPDCGADIGKNQWYFSFDMGDPARLRYADEPNGLVQNLVKQGNLLNQPEVDWRPAGSTGAQHIADVGFRCVQL